MSLPNQQDILEAYISDLQKEVAQLEVVKRNVESMRTENWSLEKRNKELGVKISEIEARESNLRSMEEEYLKKSDIFDKRERQFRDEVSEFNQKQIRLINDIKTTEENRLGIDTRIKNLSDKEKSIEAREYQVEIEKGKLEQKLKAYRDKLKIE